MRQIGTVPQAGDAQRLADYLLTLGIRCRVDARAGEPGAIWVFDEDHRDQAQSALDEFLKNPADPRYDEATRQARAIERASAAQEKQYRKNVVDLRGRWDTRRAGGRPVTMALVVISCAAALLLGFGNNPVSVGKLASLWFTPPVIVDGQLIGFSRISATLEGQWWRLITPIFIHMFPMHLAFNMFATFDLGSIVEYRLGSWRTAGMVLLIAVLSNLGEYFWDVHRGHVPYFGGMSGVAYGLFGYIWIRGRLDPGSGFFLHPTTVMIMLFWFFLCFTPAIGSVANGAHALGLGTGVLLAFLSTLARR